MQELKPQKREAHQKPQPRARERDPALWLIVIVSLGIVGAFGVGKFMQYRDNQQMRQVDGTSRPAYPNEKLSPELQQGNDRPMEAGSYTSIEAAQDSDIRSAAAIAATPAGRAKNLKEECAALHDEQLTLEARLRRPLGAQQAEQIRVQIEQISTTMQRAGC